MRLTWDEFFAAKRSETVHSELVDVDDHGTALYELVILRDGRYWSAMYEIERQGGVVKDKRGIDFFEVRPVTKTVVVYEPVEA